MSNLEAIKRTPTVDLVNDIRSIVFAWPDAAESKTTLRNLFEDTLVRRHNLMLNKESQTVLAELSSKAIHAYFEIEHFRPQAGEMVGEVEEPGTLFITEDGTFARINGEVYTFAGEAADCVAEMAARLANEIFESPGPEILKSAKCMGVKFADIFRANGKPHRAWKTLIAWRK